MTGRSGARRAREERRPGAHRVRRAVLRPVDGREQVAARAPARTPRRDADRRPARRGRAPRRRHPSARSCIRSPTCTTPVDDPLGGEVRDGRRASARSSQRREVVGHDPVELLGHPPVEAAQAGLDVRDRDAELRRGQGAGERRVRVAVDEDGVGPLGEQDGLEGHQHPRRSGRAWPPPPTPRVWSGRGRPSSAKNAPAIASS